MSPFACRFFVGLFLISLSFGCKSEEEKEPAEAMHSLVGKRAPELAGTWVRGDDPGKIADLKGKVVLLDFWAVWCGPCLATFPHLREWHEEYKDQRLAVVGVTTYFERLGFDKEKGKLKSLGGAKEEPALSPQEERGMLRDFAAYHKLSYPLLAVDNKAWDQAMKQFGFVGIPTAVLIDRQGVVRMVRSGAEPENLEALSAEIRKLLKQK